MEVQKDSIELWQCPVHKISKISDLVKQYCHTTFGKPNIDNTNKLGGLDGRVFVEFLKEFSGSLNNIEIINPQEMWQVKFDGNWLADYITAHILEWWTNVQLSKLSQVIYKKFINRYKDNFQSHNNLWDQLHFMWFSSTFIQAFDSFLLSSSRHVNTIEEWNSIKKPLWKAIANLSSIPSNIQEGLTSSHNRVNHHFGKEYPYMLDHMEKIFSGQTSNPESSFRKVREIISDKGWYGFCPALKDGVLKESFDILFDIYGRVLIIDNKSW